MIKKLEKLNGQFNAVDVIKINGDDSASVDMLVLNEEGTEMYREHNYGIVKPYPFEITDEEILEITQLCQEPATYPTE